MLGYNHQQRASGIPGVFHRSVQRHVKQRRCSVAAMLARAADRDEIAPPSQPGVISDLLTGPLLLRAALPPIGPIDDTLVNATIEAALAACGAVDDLRIHRRC